MKQLVGACLLSAAGFLPVHILPVLVAVLVAEGRTSAVEAGWTAAAYMIGQLVAATGLPLIQQGALRWQHGCAAGALLLLGLVASAHGGTAVLVGAWFVVGTASGILFYLATMFVVGFRDVALALSLRVSVSLLASGLALAGVQILSGSSGYGELVQGLTVCFATVLLLALVLYGAGATLAPAKERPAGKPAGSLALGVLYLLFAGQIGFWAFAAQNSPSLGMAMPEMLLSLAACKIVAAAVMFPLAYRERSRAMSGGFLLPGVVLAAGLLLAAGAQLPTAFVAGILLWEIGFNVLSARLQTKAVQIDRWYSGAWLTAAIFLGAATGPVLQGHAVAGGLQNVFIGFAVASALFPALCESYLRRATAAS